MSAAALDPDGARAGPAIVAAVHARAAGLLRQMLAGVLAAGAGDGDDSECWLLQRRGTRMSVSLGYRSTLQPRHDMPMFLDIDALEVVRHSVGIRMRFRRAFTHDDWLPWIDPRSTIALARELLARLEEITAPDGDEVGR
jgi:hypothetical protein